MQLCTFFFTGENFVELNSVFAELHHQKMASIRRKEALLRRKKTLLKQLIKKLRLLIQQSSELSEAESGSDQMTSPQRPISSQILPPELNQEEYAQVMPWWERIMSNKH